MLTVGLGSYKWYQSQTSSDVSARKLSPEERWTRGGVLAKTLCPKGGGVLGVPTSIEGRNKAKRHTEYQRGHWAPKGGGEL